MATYDKTVWNTGDVITASKLNNIENGILSIINGVNTIGTVINDICDNINDLSTIITTVNENTTTIVEQVSDIHLENITQLLDTAAENIQENRETINNNAESINIINERIDRLEHHLTLFNEYSDVAIIDTLPEEGTSITSNKKIIISDVDFGNSESPIWDINADSVILDGCRVIHSAIRISSNKAIAISDINIVGALPREVSNAMIRCDTNDEVYIDNTTVEQSGYNGVEIGCSTAPKKITIKDCDFTGELVNHAISIFATANNCVVNIENCHFSNVSNVLRLSNRTNASGVKVNLRNCKWDHLDSDPNRKAVVICHDYTSADKAEVIESNRFGDGKIEVAMFNCIGEDGEVVTLPADSSWAGTGDGKLMYVYADQWDDETAGKVSYQDYFEMFPDIEVGAPA